MKGRQAPLIALSEAISNLEGVQSVEVRPLTGSLIVNHDGAAADLMSAIADSQLLEICEISDEHEPSAEAKAWQEWLDRWMGDVGGKSLNLKSAAAFAFFAMALRQISAGRIMPPAATALWYGLSLLLLRETPPKAGPEGDGE